MQQEEKELRLNQLRLIVMVMTLIFAFMLVYTIYFLVDYKDKYGFFNKTTAEVIDHQVIDNKKFDLISYKVDGNEFRITTEYESKNDIGDTITIYYDTNNPLGVVYSLDSRRVWLPTLLTIFGCANIGLVVVYFLLKKGFVKVKKVATISEDSGVLNIVETEKTINETNKKTDVSKTKNTSENKNSKKSKNVAKKQVAQVNQKTNNTPNRKTNKSNVNNTKKIK